MNNLSRGGVGKGGKSGRVGWNPRKQDEKSRFHLTHRRTTYWVRVQAKSKSPGMGSPNRMRMVWRGGKAESLTWVSESEHGDKCTFKGMAQDITAEASEVTEDSQHRETKLEQGTKGIHARAASSGCKNTSSKKDVHIIGLPGLGIKD